MRTDVATQTPRSLRPTSARWLVTGVHVLLIAVCCAFVWFHLQPHLILTNTTPAGGDMGAHVWGPAYLRDNLLPHGRLTGWTMDWYAGFPALFFYFPIPSLLIALLSYVLPYGIAFKLITVLGVVTLPISAAVMAGRMGMRRPYAVCFAVATVPYLFDRGFTIYGGNIASTLAGEFSFSISLSCALLFLGFFSTAIDTGKKRGWAAALLAVTMLCHILPAIFAIVVAVVMVLTKPGVRRFLVAGTVGLVGTLIASFWLLPFAARLPFTNDMGWEKVDKYVLPLIGGTISGRDLTGVDAHNGLEPQLLRLIIPLLFAAIAFVVLRVIATYADPASGRRQVLATIGSVQVAGLVSAVVLVALRLGPTPGWVKGDLLVTTMGKAATDTALNAVGQASMDAPALRLTFYLAVVGAIVSLMLRRRAGTVLTISAATFGLLFRFMPGPSAIDPYAHGKLWNARMLPFWYLCLYLLAACAVAELGLAAIWAWRQVEVRMQPAALRSAFAAAEDAARFAHLADALGWHHAADAQVVAERLDVRALDLREGAAARRAVPQILVPLVGAFLVIGWVAAPLGDGWTPFSSDQQSFIQSWARWNYTGYEGSGDGPQHLGAKSRKDEYFDVVTTMDKVGKDPGLGCGRALWEYEGELDQMGTPMALMLLPYWTRGCIGSEEGLYFESSPTTADHFLTAGSVSLSPSNPERGLPYTSLDLAGVGIPRMQLMGVRYYMALSDEAKAQADADSRLQLVRTSGTHSVSYPTGAKDRTWNIYLVAGSDIVVPLQNQPVVATGLPHSEPAWKALSARGWFADPARGDVFIAESGPKEWSRVAVPDVTAPEVSVTVGSNADGTAKTKMVAGDPTEKYRVLGAETALPTVPVGGDLPVITNSTTNDDSVEFDVDQIGKPVLVKVSAFPNWKASGARGPWRVTPNFMVVIPTSHHVRLAFARTPIDLLATGLTLGGIALAILVSRSTASLAPVPIGDWLRRRRRTGDPFADDQPDGHRSGDAWDDRPDEVAPDDPAPVGPAPVPDEPAHEEEPALV